MLPPLLCRPEKRVGRADEFRLAVRIAQPGNAVSDFYVGAAHDEKYGMGRMKSGVDLYCRKVLIEASSDILPDWLRFVQGVVDSEDIPLNISRETMQDSSLVRRLRAVLTRRLLRFLETESRSDPAKYSSTFFPEFGQFLKEGAITDAPYASDIPKLLRFESSGSPAGSLTSLDEYISRMPPGQSAIYYLVAPHRGITCANDEMLAALALWQQWRHDSETCLRAASHGQRLIGIGNHDADFACCAAVDNLQVVPIQAEPGVLRAS
jgi:HSP90 family molecular chaperone